MSGTGPPVFTASGGPTFFRQLLVPIEPPPRPWGGVIRKGVNRLPSATNVERVCTENHARATRGESGLRSRFRSPMPARLVITGRGLGLAGAVIAKHDVIRRPQRPISGKANECRLLTRENVNWLRSRPRRLRFRLRGAGFSSRAPCLLRHPRLEHAPTTGGYPRFGTGEVAEWLNAPHSKCGIGASLSGVRIPPSPPKTPKIRCFSMYCQVCRSAAHILAHTLESWACGWPSILRIATAQMAMASEGSALRYYFGRRNRQ